MKFGYLIVEFIVISLESKSNRWNAGYLRSPGNVAAFDMPEDALASRVPTGAYEARSRYYLK